MLPDYHKYYGVVFAQLIEGITEGLCVLRLPNAGQGFYLLADSLPLYIKYSKSRKGPWTFNFQAQHLNQLQAIIGEYGQCVVAFVCASDGVATISDAELREIVNFAGNGQEAVSIRRRLNEMYAIRGTCGAVRGKVSRDSLTEIVSSQLQQLRARRNQRCQEPNTPI